MANTRNSSTERSALGVVFTVMRDMFGAQTSVRADIAMGIGLESIGIGLGVAGPYLLKVLVDALSSDSQSQWLLVYVGLFVLTWAAGNIFATWRLVYSSRVIDTLTEHYVAAAMRASLPNAAEGRDGDSSRMMGLIERLPYSLMIVVDGLIWRAAPLLIQLIISMWLIADLIPLRYAVIMGLVLIAYGSVTWLAAVRHQKHSGQANAAAASVSQEAGDVVRNARRVVLNGTLDMEIDHVRGNFQRKTQANLRMMWSLVAMSLVQYGLVGVGLTGLLAMAAWDVVDHRMTVGNFVLLQAYAFRLAMPLSGFGFILSQAAVSIANVRDVLALRTDDTNPGEEAEKPMGAARITLDHVTFRYGPGLPGLTDITLDIEPGSFTVIVGPNGSGKSTLAQLIAGSLKPLHGAVYVNDQNIADVLRQDRHHHVLYVPQFISLFNRSLRANALYPPSLQTEADLATLLAGWQFNEGSREIDFGAIVGEQGERLSGGQIQKLELARIAGVRVPAIILDESTSALDPASEEAVIATLRATFGSRTTLILITHRARIAELADQVLFLKSGRLARSGRHEALLQDSVSYQQLWKGRDE